MLSWYMIYVKNPIKKIRIEHITFEKNDDKKTFKKYFLNILIFSSTLNILSEIKNIIFEIKNTSGIKIIQLAGIKYIKTLGISFS